MSPERLDLSIPTSWSSATVKELETIARVILAETEKKTTYHPFDLQAVKIALFFLLADLKVCAPVVPEINVEEQYYLCCRAYQEEPFWKRLLRKLRREDNEPFRLYLYQIQSGINAHLKWLEQPCNLVRFPYPEYRSRGILFHGPSHFMQDFTWRRFRYANDFLSAYIKAENRLLRMQKDAKVSALDLKKEVKLVETNMSLFLATLFTRKVKTVDEDTHLIVKDYVYTSNQSFDNAKYFRRFSKVKFQVILFWWQGMQQWLNAKFPRCFKKGSVGSAMKNPLELYSRTTATMQKYLNMDEHEVNRQLYTLIFQHLEDMAKQGEELDKMKTKR